MVTSALILSIILFIAGLAGTVLPILPGAILIYGGMLLYGFMTKLTTLDAKPPKEMHEASQSAVKRKIRPISFLLSTSGSYQPLPKAPSNLPKQLV